MNELQNSHDDSEVSLILVMKHRWEAGRHITRILCGALTAKFLDRSQAGDMVCIEHTLIVGRKQIDDLVDVLDRVVDRIETEITPGQQP